MKKSIENGTNNHKHAEVVEKTLLAFLALALLAACFACVAMNAGKLRLSAGDRLTKSVLAPYTGTDEYMTEKARRAARDRTATVYVTDEASVGRQESAIENWFSNCEAFMRDMLAVWKSGARSIEGDTIYNDATWRTIAPELELEKSLVKHGVSRELSVQAAYAMLNAYLPTGRVREKTADADISPFKNAFCGAVYPVLEAGVSSRSLSSSMTKAKNAMKKTNLSSALKTELSENLIDAFMAVTVTADEDATEKARQEAAAAVRPVKLVRGQVVLKKDTVLDADDIAYLSSLGMLRDAEGQRAGFFPLLLYFALVSLGLLIVVVLFDKRLLLGRKEKLCFLAAAAAGEAFSLLFAFLEPQAAPLLLPVLLTGSLLKKEQAGTAAAFSALTLPLIALKSGAFGADAFIVAAAVFTGGMMSVLSLNNGRRSPAKLLASGLAGGAVAALVRLCPLLYAKESAFACIAGAGLLFLGAILAAFIAMLLKPFITKMLSAGAKAPEETE